MIAAKHGSPYAQEAAAAIRYCAAVNHDPRRKGLDAWLAEIESNWEDSVVSAIQASICRGDNASARKFIRDGLEKPTTRAAVLESLQKREFGLHNYSVSTLAEPRALLDDDPTLKALYFKSGRDLPDELMPN